MKIQTCLFTAFLLFALLEGVSAQVRVVGGPVVLHSNVASQWGGHTFSYVLQGQRHVFWAATLNEWETADNGEKRFLTQLVGQFPLPGTDGVPAVHAFSIKEPGAYGGNEPLLMRTPDGYLHVILGINHHTDNPRYGYGTLRYYRSARPEDVTEWVERTELIPQVPPYNQFHLRMNAAVTADGQRAALVILAISEDGSVPFNTPLIFYGHRQGLDFRFDKPIKYHEPFAFFYPLVAATEAGVVMVGNVWDVHEHATSRLIHLDWQGNILHEEELPADAVDGRYLSYDMRPVRPGDWQHLLIYHNMSPKDGPWRHDFLVYDLTTRKLRLVNEVPTARGYSNAGKWQYISPTRSVFINNPSMGKLQAWEGDILGGEKVVAEPVAGMDPLELGYQASSYVMTPNPCQGSVTVPGVMYVMSDVYNPEKLQQDPGPCSLLLWRLSTGE